jgi:NADH dehydrogenase
VNTNTTKTHVVIVGGGFAGLGCARKLAKRDDVRVTLIDRHNYHQFQPLLYQVATSELGSGDVATSLRQSLRDRANVDVKMAEVMVADPRNRTVTTRDGQSYRGDFLVLAAGSQANFFHTQGAEQHSFPLYSLDDAQRLRSRVLAVFEDADRDSRVVEKGALNFVIIGGGPTGTELAGALADMINLSMTREYPDLAVKRAQVYLVEHGSTLLAPFSVEAHEYAARTLRGKGVRLLLSQSVTEVMSDHVRLSDGTSIPTRTVVWAGGLMASPLADNSGLPRGAAVVSRCSRTSRSWVSLAYTHSATSRTFQARTVSHFLSWPPLRSNAGCGRRTTSSPRSRASRAPRSTIATRESWP